MAYVALAAMPFLFSVNMVIGRAAGATGWIVKPFAPDKLLQVVNKVCPGR